LPAEYTIHTVTSLNRKHGKQKEDWTKTKSYTKK